MPFLCADGFGEAGDSARGIPGGATLEVDLELPSWKEVEDVTGDGGVVKKTLVSTKEWKVQAPGHQQWQPAPAMLPYSTHMLHAGWCPSRLAQGSSRTWQLSTCCLSSPGCGAEAECGRQGDAALRGAAHGRDAV